MDGGEEMDKDAETAEGNLVWWPTSPIVLTPMPGPATVTKGLALPATVGAAGDGDVVATPAPPLVSSPPRLRRRSSRARAKAKASTARFPHRKA